MIKWSSQPSAMVFVALIASAVVSTPNAHSQPINQGDPRVGRAFSLQECALCHLVSPGQLSPPRIAKAPSFREIARMTSTTSTSLQVFLTTPHPTMPNLVLTPQETANVIAYILSLRGQP